MTDFSSPTLFVTGAGGYVGRNVLRHFVARGWAVRGLVRNSEAEAKVSAHGATAHYGDLTDRQSLIEGMRGADMLIHAAADTAHGRMNARQLAINEEGTRNVFRAAADAGVARALHLSTEAVLLSGAPLVDADENTPYPARFPGGYSLSKARAEQVAREMAAAGQDIRIMRPRFIWGRDDTTALPQLIAAAKSGKLAWIDGGHYLTSSTHVANVVEGMRLILERGAPGEIYHITDGAPLPFRAFITDLLASRGIEAPRREVPRWLVRSAVGLGEALAALSGGRLSGPMSRQEYATLGVEVTLNIEKARRELGYAPVISREEGLTELRSGAW